MNKYYLTTPIYYVNAAPHIGHAYTTIVADLIKRFKRMQGYQAVLTTGSDEHGVNVERAAERAGKTPLEFCDVIAREFQRQWEVLGLEIDYFQRTSSPQHARVVQDLFQRCRDNGYIYKGSYTGQYCIFDNLYVNDAKPGDPCPDCGRPTETITEENFFFKLSAFQDKLLELYRGHPEFIQPETRRNEVPQSVPELEKLRGELAALRLQRRELASAVASRGKSVTWALEADDKLSASIQSLEAEERRLTMPPRLSGLIEPGPDVATRWAAAPVSTRREVAQIILSPEHLGVMKVQRGRGIPAFKRVTWVR